LRYLLLTSLVWAFSFGLIKRYLSGLDASTLAAVRLLFSLALFLPWLRLRGVGSKAMGTLAAIGLFQFGLMYVFYLKSFAHLQSFQVALFTLFTPLWVTLLHDTLTRRFHPRFLLAAILAVVGAAIVTFRGWGETVPWQGFLLVQASNLCFALGQVFYARWMGEHTAFKDRDVFGLLYLGGFLGAFFVLVGTGGWRTFSPAPLQWGVLAYLGIVASGLGFYWWNKGAREVSNGTLALMNNLKVPLGVACSLVVFGEQADLRRLLFGGGVILFALWVNKASQE
jgi:drug/metabolite transporter (DMT)-like permease